jgi:dehydrogenase/reductase SDR family protein 7B
MADSTFENKVVWITGASSGIGEALAKRFALAGSRLIISSRRPDELSRVAGLCSGARSCAVLPLDLSKPESMADAVHSVLAREGAVDVMVHNAAVSQRAFAADASYDVDELIMRTNYLGPVALTKALLPSMRARRQGQFIVLSSVLAKFGLPGRSAYCASKHALQGFFDTLRAEVSPDNIKVMLVLPGWVRTNISMNALTAAGAPQRKMDSGTATGFTPEFVAQRILAAARSEAAEVNIVRIQEKAALYLSRFAPSLFRRYIRGRQI